MFSGAAGAALLVVLKALFGAFGDGINGWLEKKRAEATNRELGRTETISQINQGTADANERAGQVATNQPDVDDALDGWAGGKEF